MGQLSAVFPILECTNLDLWPLCDIYCMSQSITFRLNRVYICFAKLFSSQSSQLHTKCIQTTHESFVVVTNCHWQYNLENKSESFYPNPLLSQVVQKQWNSMLLNCRVLTSITNSAEICFKCIWHKLRFDKVFAKTRHQFRTFNQDWSKACKKQLGR